MNATSIDALALARAARDRVQAQANGVPFPALGSSMLADPNLIATLAARRASMPMMYPYSSSVQLEQPIGGGGIDDAVFLSLLDRQRRLQSAQGLLDPVKPNGGAALPMAAPPMALPSAHTHEVTAVTPRAPAAPSGPASPPPSRRRKPNFAEKLHAALSDRESMGAATWLPSGRSFCIINQGEFVKRVLPLFFREAKFESFARRLKRWGFRKVYEAGIHRTVFAHDLFRRDRPDLCAKMNGRDRATRASKGNDSPPPKQLLAQQQIADHQMRHRSAALAAAQQGGRSPPGAEGPPAKAIMARASDPQPQVNPAIATLAAAQPPNHSPPGAGGPFARAIMNEAMARANGPQPRVHSGSTIFAAAQPQGHAFPSAAGSLARAAMTEAMAREAMAREVLAREAMAREAMARANNAQARVTPEDTDEIRQAKAQLDRLSDDIANYNGQLAILQQLREAKSLGS